MQINNETLRDLLIKIDEMDCPCSIDDLQDIEPDREILDLHLGYLEDKGLIQCESIETFECIAYHA